TYTPPVGTDNCPGATTIQTAGLASGSAFPVGTTINTFEVTDTSGNTASCSFNVVVTDDEMPMAVCQDITVQLDASGNASIVASDVDGGSSDNCSIASSSIDITSFDCSNVGTNNVVLTVTDPAGNTSTCTAIVTVEDMILPLAICQDITIQLDGSGMATITAADIDGGSSDACGIDTTAIDVSTFDCSNIGTNNVTLTVTDMNGNMNSCVAVVTVEDVEVPDAVCQDITVQLDASGMATIVATDVDGGSTDNCGTPTLAIDMNTFDCSDVGINDVTLTVTDANGNVNSCIAEVTVEDSVAPMAVCQDITVQLDASGTVVITAADVDGGSSDACGVDSISIDMDTFDCSNVGTNDVTLTVLDVNGNTATCIAVVTVEEENATPVAVCQDITVPIQADGTAT
ncbi:MAG TPA: proprotein convertase P-domain protein, partial [Flavobacteriaceae bacterium]|nr:proprotein convertase P-domain protein [Flavobacteriaceae bacterium]